MTTNNTAARWTQLSAGNYERAAWSIQRVDSAYGVTQWVLDGATGAGIAQFDTLAEAQAFAAYADDEEPAAAPITGTAITEPAGLAAALAELGFINAVDGDLLTIDYWAAGRLRGRVYFEDAETCLVGYDGRGWPIWTGRFASSTPNAVVAAVAAQIVAEAHQARG